MYTTSSARFVSTAGAGITGTTEKGEVYCHWRKRLAHGRNWRHTHGGHWREVHHSWHCAHDRSRRHRRAGHRRNVHPHRHSRSATGAGTKNIADGGGLYHTTGAGSEDQEQERCTPPLAQTLRPLQYQVGRPSHCPNLQSEGRSHGSLSRSCSGPNKNTKLDLDIRACINTWPKWPTEALTQKVNMFCASALVLLSSQNTTSPLQRVDRSTS